MQVRPITPDDYAAVCSLLAELGRPQVTGDNDVACRAVFDADLADDSTDHLVAVDDDGRAIGFISLQFRRRLNQTTDEAWVPDLIVAETLRGSGVGKAL